MRRDRQKGAAAVEFALVLPLLLVIVFGIVEFGLLLYNKQVLTNASREGARFGIVSRVPADRRTVAEITAVVEQYCSGNLVTFGSATPQTAVTPSPTAGALFGTDLRVVVTYRYTFLMLPNFVGSIGSVSDLRAATVMKYE